MSSAEGSYTNGRYSPIPCAQNAIAHVGSSSAARLNCSSVSSKRNECSMANPSSTSVCAAWEQLIGKSTLPTVRADMPCSCALCGKAPTTDGHISATRKVYGRAFRRTAIVGKNLTGGHLSDLKLNHWPQDACCMPTSNSYTENVGDKSPLHSLTPILANGKPQLCAAG